MQARTFHSAGPLLSRLLEAQRLDEEVVGWDQIDAFADALIHKAAELDCLVWPVGAAAERVAGVATARARGAIDVGAWNTPVQGRRLLLVAVAAVSPLGLEAAAEQLRIRGAVEVHACGVKVREGERAVGLNSYKQLRSARPRRSLTPIGDAA